METVETENCHVNCTVGGIVRAKLCFTDGLTCIHYWSFAGVDPGFQVRGRALKKIAPSGGRRENFGGISCEKSRFYAKKSYFFQF